MLITELIVLWIVAVVTVTRCQQCPGGVRLRKEVHEMSQVEWNRFLAALQAVKYPNLADSGASRALVPVLQNLTLTNILTLAMDDIRRDNKSQAVNVTTQMAIDQSSSINSYDDFAAVHHRYRASTHQTPIFLPWHRELLNQFELRLRQVDPTVTLPYWNWSLESAAPQQSMIWQIYGTSTGDGQGSDGCIQGGEFSFWQDLDEFSRPSCIRREFNQADGSSQFGAVFGSNCAEKIVRSARTFEEFAAQLTVIHDQFHWYIGGQFQDTRTSAGDPLFYLHHGFIDNLFERWLQLNPRASLPTGTLPGFVGADIRQDARFPCVRYSTPSDNFSSSNNSTGNGTIAWDMVGQMVFSSAYFLNSL